MIKKHNINKNKNINILKNIYYLNIYNLISGASIILHSGLKRFDVEVCATDSDSEDIRA